MYDLRLISMIAAVEFGLVMLLLFASHLSCELRSPRSILFITNLLLYRFGPVELYVSSRITPSLLHITVGWGLPKNEQNHDAAIDFILFFNPREQATQPRCKSMYSMHYPLLITQTLFNLSL